MVLSLPEARTTRSGQDNAKISRVPPAVGSILNLARQRLRMDVGMVSLFARDDEIVWAVDGDSLSFGLFAGTVLSLPAGYSARVVDGRVPELHVDVGRHHILRELAFTQETGIRAYVVVPLVTEDETIGALSLFSHDPRPDLQSRAVGFVRAIGQVLTREIEGHRRDVQGTEKRERLLRVMQEETLTMHYQPIVDLATHQSVGFEALARFNTLPKQGPDRWFADARSVGLEVDLDLSAIRAGLEGLPRLPEDTYLSLNLQPATLGARSLVEVLKEAPGHRLVLELTEHEQVEDYAALLGSLGVIRGLGVRLAIDDVGAGFSSLQHILRLTPDVLKLDAEFSLGIDRDRVRGALVGSLVSFARSMGAVLVAEAIETPEQMRTLMDLGVRYGQGYHLGRPKPMAA